MTKDKAYKISFVNWKDVETLYWLEDHGYSGDFLRLAECQDDSRVDGPQSLYVDKYLLDSAYPLDYQLDQSSAQKFLKNVLFRDREAFLSCNGSPTLEKALQDLIDEIEEDFPDIIPDCDFSMKCNHEGRPAILHYCSQYYCDECYHNESDGIEYEEIEWI